VELCPVALLVTSTLSLLDFGLENLCLVVGSWFCELGEDVAGVEELGVEVLGRFVAAADDEDFGGDVSTRRWLGCLDLGEELVEDPEERVVVLGAENLGAEGSALLEELDSELEGGEYELDLGESVLHPGGSDVGSSVVENAIARKSVSAVEKEKKEQEKGKRTRRPSSPSSLPSAHAYSSPS
jgi:hypothetical protein